jgi:glycerol kinase
MKKQFVLAIDQGTTSCRAILVDKNARVAGVAQRELPLLYPKPGWVEQSAEDIWIAQFAVIAEVLAKASVDPAELAAVGIANQRETAIVWERDTGKPVCNAISWQCCRSTTICDQLRTKGLAGSVRSKTGLVIDAYFSGTKLKWILDNICGAREGADNGDLLFGTVDSWLMWNLTDGQVHATDYSNASRTMLYNIRDLTWDTELIQELGIPISMLPSVGPSSGVYGLTDPDRFFGHAIPIAGVAGDQQAALFGQTCYEPGSAKNTYGTGCFMLMNTGEELCYSPSGLLSTIAWGAEGKVTYALEGSVFSAGATIQWLRDGLRILDSASDCEYLATKVKDTGGVYFVPAFVGLGAPYWDVQARGTIVGLTRGTTREHIIRAALEAMAYQTTDVLAAMEVDSGIRLQELKVDGGAAANDLLMQFQADLLGVPVVRPTVIETTALGAAFLAGLAVGFWRSRGQLTELWQLDRRFEPGMAKTRRSELHGGWRLAVARAMTRGARDDDSPV